VHEVGDKKVRHSIFRYIHTYRNKNVISYSLHYFSYALRFARYSNVTIGVNFRILYHNQSKNLFSDPVKNCSRKKSECRQNAILNSKQTKLPLHLTLRRLMSYIYIYMEHPFLMFLDHTQRRSTVGRTPLDE